MNPSALLTLRGDRDEILVSEKLKQAKDVVSGFLLLKWAKTAVALALIAAVWFIYALVTHDVILFSWALPIQVGAVITAYLAWEDAQSKL